MSEKWVVLSVVLGLISAQPVWIHRAANYVPAFWRIGLAPPPGLYEASNPGVTYVRTVPTVSVPRGTFGTVQNVAYAGAAVPSPAVSYLPSHRVAYHSSPRVNIPVLSGLGYQQPATAYQAGSSSVSSTQNYGYASNSVAQSVNGVGSAIAAHDVRASAYDSSSATASNSLGYSVSSAQSAVNSLDYSTSSAAQSIDGVGTAVSTAESADAYGEYNSAVSTAEDVGDFRSSSSQVVQQSGGVQHRSASSTITGSGIQPNVLYYY